MDSLHEISLALFFFFFISYSCFSYGAYEGSVSFNFPSETGLQLSSDASFSNDIIELTNSSKQPSIGWATYTDTIPLWDNSSQAVASFSTHFQFSISKVNNDRGGSGDGLAFFLAPFDFQSSMADGGEWLGLFKPGSDTSSETQIVAVEFDTFQNQPYDPDDNHVGIDVNSQITNQTVSVYHLFGNHFTLRNGKKWDAWVDYNGTVAQLQVFLSFNLNSTADVSKPQIPILVYNINLRKILPDNVKVGFSASTGKGVETHTVHIWNFSSQYSWNTSAPTVQGTKTNSSDQGTKSKSSERKFILASLLVCFILISGLIFVRGMLYINSRKNQPKGEESDEKLDEWLGIAAQCARKFLYADLMAATNNFSDTQKIGGGGFGWVYRGTLPRTNEAVAVKRVSPTAEQGKNQYISEVIINSKLTHHNLVRFLGWCHRKDDFLLVYELLSNGSLDKYLFEKVEPTLNWDRRYSIACDVASSLVYLHEDRYESVVHRDIKASNVMLDSNFKAKLGDFGLARAVKREKGGHTTVVAGTMGYIAPESVTTGKATRESDVFSFGALALEIGCGRRPTDQRLNEYNSRVVEWVWHLYGQHKILDAVDEKLGGHFNEEEMERLIKVGLLCSHPDPNARLRMEQVVGILKRGAEVPHVPLEFPVPMYDHRPPNMTSSSTSTVNETVCSLEGI